MFSFLLSHALALPPAPKVVARYSVPELRQRELCYPSGLRAHLVERADSGLAAVSSVVGAGTADESAEQRGAAHLVEHLWFHARPGDGPRVWDRSAGIVLDASTWHDATTYTTIGAASDLEKLLAIDAARLNTPLAGVDAASLDLEKRIVKDELQYRGEHGTRMALDRLHGMLFPEGHPYRHTIATSADVDALTVEALKSYTDAFYVPATTTVSVEAERALDEQQAALEAAFGSLLEGAGASCEHPRAEGAPPPPTSPGTMETATAPVVGKQVYLGWSLPAAWGPDHRYETMATSQLSSVLRSSLPWARGLKGDQSGASLGCSYLPGRQAARVLCRIDLPADTDAKQVVQLALGSLDQQWGISSREQDERRRLLSGQISRTFQQALVSADDLSAGAMESRALERHGVGTIAPVIADLDSALAIDPDQLARTAATWLTADRAAILVVEPGDVVEAESSSGLDGSARLSVDALPDWKPVDPGLSLTTSTLPTGLDVVRSYRGTAPATRVALSRPVGELNGPDGLRFFWDSTAVYRLPGVSLTDLRMEAGVSSWDDMGLGHGSVHAFASDGSSDLALWSIRVWLDSLDFDPAYLQATVDRSLETLEGDLATWPLLHTRSLRDEHLYPGHPWARPWWRDIAAARKTREGAVLKWRKAQDRVDLATLLVVSPSADVDDSVEKYLGKWKGGKAEPVPAPAVPAAPAGRKVMALAANGGMTDVRVACRVQPRTDANDAAQDVLEAVLRHGVWQTMREGGGSYAPRAGVSIPGPGLATANLGAVVPHGQAPAAVKALTGLLADVVDGVDDNVVAFGRLEAAGQHARAHSSTMSHFHALHGRLAQGLSLEALTGYSDRLDAVDSAALQALLGDCIGKEAITVVGPDPMPGLSGAGLAPEQVDWRQRAVDEAKAVR